MGAWGVGPFENDDALDFVVDLGAASDWAVVAEAIDRVVNAPEAAYIEAPEASVALSQLK